jgi:class 3 adenylate cyclase/TolB-like protein
MLPNKKRRLAAILFADIVGYTAMMQSDEAAGIARASRLRSVVENLLPQHGGQLVEMRGDGAFCLFESSTEAVRCAIRIQQALRAEVPLRIGLHLGDITERDGHIFGDAVNLASRIESMGVAGAVLLSDSIRRQIKNKPEFELRSLGPFAFKNVAEPMEVFAVGNAGLVVPKAEEMQGKGERMQAEKPGMKSIVRFASIGFVAMAVGAILFWAVGTKGPEEGKLLDEDIREAKVAVAVFENYTSDEDLDALGYLASEWITSSLREIGVKTVAPEMMRQYKDYVGIFPGNPEGKTSLAEVTQAQYLISGSYFAQGDSIRLNTRLLNAIGGEEVQAFPVFWKKKEEKEALVEEARQRLMGFWAIENNQHFPKVSPPKYEAYQKYLSCIGGGLPCYEEVLELDSSFLLAHTAAMYSAVWWEQEDKHFRSRKYLDRNQASLTAYEQNYYLFGKHFWEGEYEQAFEALERNYQTDPLDIWMLHEAAYFASAHLNRPDIAVEKYQQLFSNYELFRDKAWNAIYYHYTESLNRLGKHQEVIDFAYQLPAEDWLEKADWLSWLEYYLALLETDQRDRAVQYVDTIVHHSWMGTLSRAAYGWSAFHQDTLPNPFHERIRKNLASSYTSIKDAGAWDVQAMHSNPGPFNLQVYQSYLLGDWEQAEEEMLKLRGLQHDFSKYPDDHWLANANEGVVEVWVEAMIGFIYARQGKYQEALLQIELLESLRADFPEKHSPSAKGYISYQQARILALLGEKEEAVRHVQKSLDEGRIIIWWNFTLDWELSGLRGYEPFEELIRPKG